MINRGNSYSKIGADKLLSMRQYGNKLKALAKEVNKEQLVGVISEIEKSLAKAIEEKYPSKSLSCKVVQK